MSNMSNLLSLSMTSNRLTSTAGSFSRRQNLLLSNCSYSLISRSRCRAFSTSNNDSNDDNNSSSSSTHGGAYWRRSNSTSGSKTQQSNNSQSSSDNNNSNSTTNSTMSSSSNSESSSSSISRLSEPPWYQSMTVLPILRRPLFPGQRMPIIIRNPKIAAEIQKLCKADTPYIGLFLRADEVGKTPGEESSSSSSGTTESTSGPTGPGSPYNAPQSTDPVSADLNNQDPELITHPSQLYDIGTLGIVTQSQMVPASFGLIVSTATSGSGSSSGVTSSGLAGSTSSSGRTGSSSLSTAQSLLGTSSSSSSSSSFPPGYALQITVSANRRLSLNSIENFGPPTIANVEHWRRNSEKDPPSMENDSKALVQEAIRVIRDIFNLNPNFKEFVSYTMQSPTFKTDHQNPGRLADFATSLSSASAEEQIEILRERSGYKRLQLAYKLLLREKQICEAQIKIRTSVDEKVQTQQREYFLREQLRAIKKELGLEKDDKDSLVQKFKDRIEGKTIPKEIEEVIETELEKLSSLDKNSSEFNVSRNYLDWLTVLPYNTYSTDNFNIYKAKQILDRDHYGLQDVKDRILEFIGVGKLKGTVQGKIICLVGPPGTGKTSIGKSVAESLGREFYRFSVGGLSDVAEIKGHRRTYIGSMPGKLIQCLKQTKVSNPMILIDEIDKLGRGYQGDPSSALLEVLDPSQNATFLDHFLDVPIDLSNVLFLCTANLLDTIPGPLLDRMEVVRLSGYDHPEKERIAKDYLIPKVMEQTGLTEVEKMKEEAVTDSTAESVTSVKESSEADSESSKTESDSESTDTATTTDTSTKSDSESESDTKKQLPLFITDSAIDSMIRWYCREAGVRNLQKQIEKLCRKRAFQRAEIKDRREHLQQKEDEKRKKIEDEKKAKLKAEEDAKKARETAVTIEEDLESLLTIMPKESSSSDTVTESKSDSHSESDTVTKNDSESKSESVSDSEPTSTVPVTSSESESSTTDSEPVSTDSDPPLPRDPETLKELEDIQKSEDALNTPITSENLHDYLGKPLFTSDKLYETPPAGVVCGLAWTAMGGTTLYIETRSLECGGGGGSGGSSGGGGGGGNGTLSVTGQLGNVMQESSRISQVVAKQFHPKILEYCRGHDIYLHVPEGATPKDGPSAGITMTTALISLALNKPVLKDLAMTGEVSLTGLVMPVGGIREKTIAGRRSGCKRLIFAEGNRRDVEELPVYLKEGVEILFAKSYDDVYRHAFGEDKKELDKEENGSMGEKESESLGESAAAGSKDSESETSSTDSGSDKKEAGGVGA